MALPQNPRAAFRADHRIVGVLQHGDAVAYADSQRAAGSAFPNHHADYRRSHLAHLEHALGDHMGLSTLLRPDAGIGARRVDEADDGHVVLFRQPHFAHGFAVTLRMRAAKIAGGALAISPSFLMPDNHHFELVDFGETGQHCAIIAKVLVAMQFDKLVECQIEIVARVWPVLMTRHLHGLPGSQIAIHAGGYFVPLPSQGDDLLFDRTVARPALQKLLDFGFYVEHGLFKIGAGRCLGHNVLESSNNAINDVVFQLI